MAIPLRRLRRKQPQFVEAEVPAPKRRRWLVRRGKRSIAAVITAVVVVAVAAFALVAGGGGEPAASTNASLEFATVRRTDLVAVRDFDGEVTAKAGPDVGSRVNGTITWLPEVGATVERGHALYAVDGLPVTLMYGSTPAFRDFGGSITGEDVKQLEENLDALGFDPGTVDTTFTESTAAAIEAWQDSIDVGATGVVKLGRVVFAPGPLTIAEQLKATGAQIQNGEDVLSTESSDRVVEAPLTEADDLSAGDIVEIILSDNSRAPGKVLSVDGGDASGAVDGGESIVATIAPDDTGALAEVEDGADADVEFVEDAREDVLVVPVTALLARQGGGYAVEVQRGGTTRLVEVDPGLYADDLVEVDGDLEEGDRVVVP